MANRIIVSGHLQAHNDVKSIAFAMLNSTALNKALDSGSILTAQFLSDEAPKDTRALSRSMGFVKLRPYKRLIKSVKSLRNSKSGKLAKTYAQYAHEHHPYADIVFKSKAETILDLIESAYLKGVKL